MRRILGLGLLAMLLACGGDDPVAPDVDAGTDGAINDACVTDCDASVDVNECVTDTDNCDANATCTNTTGAFTCACNDGFTGNGVTCTDVDECLTANGGCDTLTTCANNPGPVVTCGACPTGYVGDGTTGCTPTLTGLTLSSGTLTPALSDAVTSYAVSVTLSTQTITLTPTAPTGATITINAQAVVSGATWTSPTLNLGDNAVTIVVSQTGHRIRSYTLTVDRNYAQQAYVKASNTGGGDQFGVLSVALSGDGSTLVVGAFNESSNATGINGNQADNSATDSGAVYVFR